jgi:hypothetical protein
VRVGFCFLIHHVVHANLEWWETIDLSCCVGASLPSQRREYGHSTESWGSSLRDSVLSSGRAFGRFELIYM